MRASQTIYVVYVVRVRIRLSVRVIILLFFCMYSETEDEIIPIVTQGADI